MEFTNEIEKATAPIYKKISKVLPEVEWPTFAPYIFRINQLKKEKNAVILAHNYQTPEIYHGVSDFSGLISFAVSAIKCTPHIIIISALVFAASTASAKESAEKSDIP